MFRTMRHVVWAALVACHSAPPVPAPAPKPAAPAAPIAAETPAEKLAVDTPKTTVGGVTFVAPAGWTYSVRGSATILEAPERGNTITLVDIEAQDADLAVALAWTALAPDMEWPLEAVTRVTARNGWSSITHFFYKVPPNQKRGVGAIAAQAAGRWTVMLLELDDAVAEKRGAQLGVVAGQLMPKGYTRETFAGKKANPLEGKRLAELTDFVEKSRTALGVTGIAIGIVQDGKVVFAGGFGEKELGKKTKPDADTLFMIASNTKPLTTLLLAKLVDDKQLTWDTPVTQVMPTFKLGDAATTKSVLVKHLVCACTGLPRQDLEWRLEFKHATPKSAMALLGTMQPTSKFGELFQYSNMLAGAGGYVAAYLLAPDQELGASYDAAMAERVFKPLGMTSTTFDTARALRGNHAGAFGLDINNKPAPVLFALSGAMSSLRPAGGAWSSVRDLLKYLEMELARGALPGGKRYISEGPLLARRTPQIEISKTEAYGMGLIVDTEWGIPLIHHGGDLVGYHSDILWLPDHGVGAVILTNTDDAGPSARVLFERKLLEVLFDGTPLAEAELVSAARQIEGGRASLRGVLEIPASVAVASKLAARYTSAALGDITVKRVKGVTILDVGEWASPVGTRTNTDGTVSLVMLAPGALGMQFVVGADQSSKRTLTVRDNQHEYTFVEVR
jgi:CubicO group peptidase (beta-lactamase class C family)